MTLTSKIIINLSDSGPISKVHFSIILTLKFTQFKTKDSCFRLRTLFAMNQSKPSSLSNLDQLNPAGAGLSLVEGTWVDFNLDSTFNWPLLYCSQ